MSCTNRTTTMGRALLGKITFVAGLATVSALSGVASASMVPLTGGDSGEGYSPYPTVAYAYNVGTSTDLGFTTTQRTVQGVEFLGWDHGATASPPASPANPAGIPNTSITMSGSAAFSTANVSMGASTNDVNMRNLLQTGAFVFTGVGGSMTLTLGGLTVGQPYQVDILVEINSGAPTTRAEAFSFAGATTVTEPTFNADSSHGYDVSEVLKPNASTGQIVVTLTNDGSNPFLNAFSVTLAPEPASLGFLSAGGLLLLRRRRDRRRVAA